MRSATGARLRNCFPLEVFEPSGELRQFNILNNLSTELGMVLRMLRWRESEASRGSIALGDGGWAPSLWLLEDRLLFGEVPGR